MPYQCQQYMITAHAFLNEHAQFQIQMEARKCEELAAVDAFSQAQRS
jgi:hypothetical protein